MPSPPGRPRTPTASPSSTSTATASPTPSCTTECLRWAAAYQRLGVVAGDHVATMVPTGFTGFAAWFGLGWLRVTEVPLNTAYTGRMLHYALEFADVSTLVVAGRVVPPGRRDGRRAAPPEGGRGRRRRAAARRVRACRSACSGAVEFLDGVDPGRPASRGPSTATSRRSSTRRARPARPRACCRRGPRCTRCGRGSPRTACAPGEGAVLRLPHVPQSAGSRRSTPAWCAGARYVFRDKFSATHFWDDVRRTGVVVATLVGPMTALLAAQPARPDDADNPLRAIVLGPMIPEMEAFERRFGVQIGTCYGMTEIGRRSPRRGTTGPGRRAAGPAPTTRARGGDRRRARRTRPHGRRRRADRAPPRAVVAERRLLQDARGDGRGMAQRLVPHRRRVPVRRGRLVLLRRPDEGRDPPRGARTSRRSRSRTSSSSTLTSPTARPSACLRNRARTRSSWPSSCATRPPSTRGADRLPRGAHARFMVPRYLEVMDDLPRNETSMRVRKFELRRARHRPETWDREAHRGGPSALAGGAQAGPYGADLGRRPGCPPADGRCGAASSGVPGRCRARCAGGSRPTGPRRWRARRGRRCGRGPRGAGR